MSEFLEKLAVKRQKFLDGLDANEGDINLDIFEDFYPDRAHFVFELLQNAEDAGATEAKFGLSKNGCAFEHNGTRVFTENDVRAITGIHNSSKSKAPDQIGKFGVGFKSVFVYTLEPHIFSGSFSFQISQMVMPIPVTNTQDIGNRTRFWLPFNNPKKAPETSFTEIASGLNELAETTLLFLSNLEVIQWEMSGGSRGEVRRIMHTDNHFEILKQGDGSSTSSSHFLKFLRPVRDLEKQHLAIAFELEFLPKIKSYDRKNPLAKQMKIVSAIPGRVSVFFPAEKETSGLRFHLHAPFVPELSRASIKETPANQPLFEQLAQLAAMLLYPVRDLGLLTADFLAVLPNPQDQLLPRYQCIREAIIKVMNTQSLTPTYAKTHAPAQILLQAKASLKELLSSDDIEFLVDYDAEPPQWAISAAQKNSNADRFLAGLSIREWDVDVFIKLLVDKAKEGVRYISLPPSVITGPSKEFMDWLSLKQADWHQRLYGLLYLELGGKGILARFKGVRVVLLAAGGHSVGEKCYFQNGELDHSDFSCVNQDAYLYGKNKALQEDARKFLEEVGVREIGEAEQIEAILKQRYDADETFEPNMKDFPRFVAFIEKEPGRAEMFGNYWILKRKDGKWEQPGQTYLDVPFFETGLKAWYESFGEEAECYALSDDYLKNRVNVSKVVEFARAVGVHTCLQITETTCYKNPNWEYLRSVPGERYTSSLDKDYEISGLEESLSNPSIGLSKLLWRTMCSLPSHPHSPVQYQPYLNALYQKNETNGCRRADSQLVCHLKRHKWIPQGDDVFVHPKDALRELLPAGFTYDDGYKWLEAIGFGESVHKKKETDAQNQEAQRTRRDLAVLLGFPDEQTFDDAQKFAELPPEERQWLMGEIERKKQIVLPEHESKNPERRANLVGQQAMDALDKTTEKRQRSVSVGRDEVKKEAAQYLTQLYTNGDGVMICQVCKAPLPFKLDDGSYYFEKVEFLPPLAKRHHQNYLALCPNHAAMFQHANGTDDLLQEMFAELSGNELEVVLAQEDATIYFTKTHIADLQVVISTEAEEGIQKDPSDSVEDE